jgi:predicted metal-dependent HD superfamily phosphohydrolase
MNKNYLQIVEQFVLGYYDKNTPVENVYHNIEHVKNVVSLVEEIGENSGVNNEEIEILKIAAWFHDIGHLEIWEGHEEKSAAFAREYLLAENYPVEKINKITGCILATTVPHKPKNKLEKIICDADIAHVGSESFFAQSDLLKLELAKRKKKSISDIDWLNKNISFVERNNFYTSFANNKYKDIRNKNLLLLKEKLKSLK